MGVRCRAAFWVSDVGQILPWMSVVGWKILAMSGVGITPFKGPVNYPIPSFFLPPSRKYWTLPKLRWTIRDIFIHINSFTKNTKMRRYFVWETSFLKKWHKNQKFLYTWICNFLWKISQMTHHSQITWDFSPLKFSGMKFHILKMMDQVWRFCEWSFLYKKLTILLDFCEWIYVYENVTHGPSHKTALLNLQLILSLIQTLRCPLKT